MHLIVESMDRWATGLTGKEWKLLMLLSEQADDHTRECFPELDKPDSVISIRMGCGRSHLYATLNGLIEKGAVERVKRDQKHQSAVLRITAESHDT